MKLVSGPEAVGILDAILKGETEKLRKATNCGDPNCPVHAEFNQEQAPQPGAKFNPADLITNKDLEPMTSAEAYEIAIGTTAGAHNALVRREHKRARRLQKQAELWFEVASVLNEAESRIGR